MDLDGEFWSDSSSDDDENVLSISQAAYAAALEVEAASNGPKRDHRKDPRSSRRVFRSGEALHCIRRDYMGIPGDPSTPLLGAEFPLFFRVSRTRFQVMMEDIMAANIPFYMPKKNRLLHLQSSVRF